MALKLLRYLPVLLIIGLFGFLLTTPALALDKQKNQTPSEPQPMVQGTVDSDPKQGSDMMDKSGMSTDSGKSMMASGGSGGMDMMDQSSGGDMMGKMKSKMMRMMKSHMMGGPGGMSQMMGGMNSGDGKKMKGGMMARMTTMLERLNLTPEQWDKVRNVARQSLEKMVDLWAQHTKLEIELSALRWDQKVDEQRIKKLFVKQAEAKADMFLAGLNYMRTLKNVLTASQAKKLEGLDQLSDAN